MYGDGELAADAAGFEVSDGGRRVGEGIGVFNDGRELAGLGWVTSGRRVWETNGERARA